MIQIQTIQNKNHRMMLSDEVQGIIYISLIFFIYFFNIILFLALKNLLQAIFINMVIKLEKT